MECLVAMPACGLNGTAAVVGGPEVLVKGAGRSPRGACHRCRKKGARGSHGAIGQSETNEKPKGEIRGLKVYFRKKRIC